MGCFDRHIPNSIILWRRSLGNLEKNLQTADQTGDKLNLNMMPLQEWNSSHKGAGVGVGWGCSYHYFIFALLLRWQRVERNPKCSLKSSFLLKSILLRIPNLCCVKIKKAILFCQP